MSESNVAFYASHGSAALDTESALVLAGVLRGAQRYWDDDSETASIGFDDYGGGFVDGSEPEYRRYEIVCPVTQLTRHKDLRECPHCEDECSTITEEDVAA